MTRTLSPEVQQALDDASTKGLAVSILFFADFEDDPVYVWSGVGPIEYNGNIYKGVGDMGTIGSIIEDSKLADVRFNATLSSIPEGSIPDIIGAITDGNPTGRDFTIDLGFQDADAQLVGVLPLTAGFMDGSALNEAPNDDGGLHGSVSLNLASEATRLSKRKFTRQTNQAQQELFTGDLGFEFVADTNMGEIAWGQKSSISAGASSGGNNSGDSSSKLDDKYRVYH